MENTRKLKMAPLERSLFVDFESYMIFKNMCISNCGKSGEIDIKDSPSWCSHFQFEVLDIVFESMQFLNGLINFTVSGEDRFVLNRALIWFIIFKILLPRSCTMISFMTCYGLSAPQCSFQWLSILKNCFTGWWAMRWKVCHGFFFGQNRITAKVF